MTVADDAVLAASLFAVDPAGLGGVCLRSLPQPARQQWLDALEGLLPAGAPIRRMPFNIPDGRLFGGLDLTATLKARRPIAERGALAAAHGGVVVVTMAERLSAHTAACLNAVLDAGEVNVQREGVEERNEARIGVVTLDEGMDDDERVPSGLLDRSAFLIDLSSLDLRSPLAPLHDAAQIDAARRRLPHVVAPAAVLSALCATAMALGAGSLRVAWLAVRAAKALAALDGRSAVEWNDAVTVGRLVLAPRATQLPAPPPAPAGGETDSEPGATAETPDLPDTPNTPETPEPPAAGAEPPESAPPRDASAPQPDERGAADSGPSSDEELHERLLAATQAAIPAGLLARLRVDAARRSAGAGSSGRVGAERTGGARGRPAGVRAGTPRGHARLDVLETLRAAAPWQRLRGRHGSGDGRLRIEGSDFRVKHHRQRSQTLTIFAVDASGSAALNRLAEAKGAVELLLGDCYVRRDQVAVVAFRGRGAELLLPPTRSLVRAKRHLAGLPGGGATPLAAALDTALAIASAAQRRGDTPLVVLLSDGRANVARDGSAGRAAAHADAHDAARRLGRAQVAVLFVDTSPRPNPQARELAAAMRAEYVPLPFADARALSAVVATAMRPGSP